MSNTKKKAMQELVARCSGFAEVLALFQSEVESLYADDADPPAELAAALDALDKAHAAFEVLDTETK